ncbi:MAG: class I SAM-dependent methyltransferase [Alphaproteobacteria bacterium]|nr:class I SAM-dependent methyltransferase [Alphaproteobacteria bacterium]
MTLRDLHRIYLRTVLPQSHLVRRFIAQVAPAGAIKICVEIGGGNAPFEDAIRNFWQPQTYLQTDMYLGDRTDVAADATALPLASNSVNLIAAFQMLQHVEAPNIVLREAARVLAPGGNLLLTYPFMYAECDVHDFWRWTREGMERDCADAGFETVTHRKIGGLFYMVSMMMTAAIAALIPGRRANWRGSSSLQGILRIVAIMALALPFQIFGWIGLLADQLFPNTPFYMGGMILLRKRNR